MNAVEITAIVAEPPWPTPPLKYPVEWQQFSQYSDYLSTRIVAGLLENEGVPTRISSANIFLGNECDHIIWVPKELAHRARWILALPPPTDAELLFLATGELLPNHE